MSTPEQAPASQARPDDAAPGKGAGRRSWATIAWRAGAVAVFVAAGALFVTTSLNSRGLDLRASGVTDLASVVRQERARADALQAQIADLNQEVRALTEQVDDTSVSELQTDLAGLRPAVGFEAVRGSSVTVTLTDAPNDDNLDKANEESNLVVHQQDIQAVANALWAGGAEAVTIQGQRVISTTGIKCVGNTVVLHGIPYAPPYRISAIGDTDRLLERIEEDPAISEYRSDAETLGLGYDVDVDDDTRMPAYTGAVDFEYAEPNGRGRKAR